MPIAAAVSGRTQERRGGRGRWWLAVPVAGCLLPAALAATAHAGAKTIEGTIRVDPAFAGQIEAGDRLVIKLFHPGAGVELDPQYRTIDDFTLPFEFSARPSTDMSGRTRFQDYVVEVFTDKDDDVLKVAPGELKARSAGPVRLGTTGLVLELKARRE
jgi:hypothetical protein